MSSNIDLANLQFSQGIKFYGAKPDDYSGWAVSSVGDFNGDNIDDIIIGAPTFNHNAGESYVIFGKNSTILDNIDLAKLNNAQGFKILGAKQGDNSGWSVSSAGDFNRDGIRDIIIGAQSASPSNRNQAGESYVVFGQKATVFNDINLNSLNSSQGFKILGANPNDWSGWSVSSAGDFNGDSISDIIIGAPGPLNSTLLGKSYVILGKNAIAFNNIDLSFLNNTQGFKILGANLGDASGISVSNVGDFNNDGTDDIIIGAHVAAPFNRTRAGESYVIFGKNSTVFYDIDLAILNNTLGFKVLGANPNDESGISVSGAGDFNGDGISDIIIGAPGRLNSILPGSSYVIFGKQGTAFDNIDLRYLNNTQGFKILGANANDACGYSVSMAGDLNRDGFDDIIIGAYGALNEAGESYAIFGKNGTIFYDINLATLNHTQGFKILGANAKDQSGNSVSGVGDFNGDGISDVLIGAPWASPSSDRTNAGESYLIYNITAPVLPPTPIPPPWWELYVVEIGLPIVGGLTLIGAAFGWYKYNHCNGFFTQDPEHAALINQVSPDSSGTWYT